MGRSSQRRPSGCLIAAHQGQAGQSLILMALMMVALLGFAGFAMDYGYATVKYRRAQNASDAAALGAAAAINSGSNESAATSVAQEVVQQNGFPSTDVTLTYLDSNGNATSNASQVNSVNAVVRDTFPTTFMRVLGIDTSSVSTAASARVAATAPCVFCVLATSGTTLPLSGNGSIDVAGGGIGVDSNSSSAVTLSGNGNITGTSIGIVGGYRTSGNGTLNPTPVKISPFPDPMASVPVPNCGSQGTTSVSLSGNQSMTINPGNYDSLNVSGNGTLTLNTGLYCITSSVNLSGNGNLVGNGVIMYFTCGGMGGPPAACSPGQTGGEINLSGNGSYRLTAPTSGTYQGLETFYDRNNAAQINLSGNGNDNYTGTIYAKSAQANLSGNGGVAQFNSMIIVATATMSGNGTFDVVYQKSQNYQNVGYPALSQ